MEDMPKENIAETVRDVMKEVMPHAPVKPPESLDLDKAHLVEVSQGRSVSDFSEIHRKAAETFKPLQRKGKARMQELESLIAWANRFKSKGSVLYANADAGDPSLLCIADYHEAGAATIDPIDGDETARHCHHRASYSFPLSKEWKAWKRVSGVPLDKDQLGVFIEDRALDVQNPTPGLLAENPENLSGWETRLRDIADKIEGRWATHAQLLSMSKKFRVFEVSNINVESNRDSGEQVLAFESEHRDEAGEKLRIPNLLIITIPIFERGALYRIPVRLQYRKSGSTVKFTLTMHGEEAIFDSAIREASQKAADDTELPLFFGHPET